MKNMQIRALKRWEFSYDGHFDVYRGENEGVKKQLDYYAKLFEKNIKKVCTSAV